MFLPMEVRRQRQRRWLPWQQVAVCCYLSSPSRSSSSLRRNWIWTKEKKNIFFSRESFVRNKNATSELYFHGREICKSIYKFRKFPPICMGSINTVILYILTYIDLWLYSPTYGGSYVFVNHCPHQYLCACMYCKLGAKIRTVAIMSHSGLLFIFIFFLLH